MDAGRVDSPTDAGYACVYNGPAADVPYMIRLGIDRPIWRMFARYRRIRCDYKAASMQHHGGESGASVPGLSENVRHSLEL